MIYDIVFPNNNEQEFINQMDNLGYDGLIFIYEKQLPKNIQKKTNIHYIKQNTKGFINNPKRDGFESKQTKLIYNQEIQEKSDFIHHRNSGLNHVLANLAKQKDILIGFNFNNILRTTKKQRAKIIGRQKQNIRLTKHNNIAIFSGATKPIEQRTQKQLKQFYGTLGLDTKKQKTSMQNISKYL